MARVRVYDIKWDTDGKKVDLPTEVVISIKKKELEDTNIADILSDKYGWCIFSLKVEEIGKKKSERSAR